MPSKSATNKKPKLSANFKKALKERGTTVDIKFGIPKWFDYKIENTDLEAIIMIHEQMDDPSKYNVIPKGEKFPTEIVSCIIYTLGDDQDGKHSTKMKAAQEKQGVEEKNVQSMYWAVKCEAAPNNSLLVWLTKEQYANLDYNEAYIFIGILQRQWSRKKLDEAGAVVKGKDGKDIYENLSEKPAEGEAYEKHSLNLIDFIG